ncbi:helix-turn-helix domain-containing protein [Alkaliphilus serpentinus]|uniref:Helix-turn-helix transcriptional regulator n=1 Tax=Alkaliphilus serpentinus TaxID=1482731 RepID=A0A833HPC2_9FIRM|nr:helix-turn-helix transcriptional regulator [Alkaliphilus serpentinus]KAB3530523.1 helix-turn-helix transcriptional regulator [Alkaliphilus serpentinus]
MNIGERIKAKRREAGLTQQQLGGQEFTKGYISQIEKGIVEPSMKVLTLISQRLDAPISYFLDEANEATSEIQRAFIKGENYYLQKQYPKALKVFEDIVTRYSRSQSSFYCLSMFYLGKSLYSSERYLEAIEILQKSLSPMEDLSLLEALAEGYSFLGLSYFSLNHYERSIGEFKRSLRVIEENHLNIPSLQAKAYLNIGTAYSNTGRFKRALKAFKKNIHHCQMQYITDTLLDCHVRIGYCSYMIGDYITSKVHISKAIAINKSLNYEIISCEVNNILGLVVAAEGRIKDGLKLLKKSRDIASKINNEFGINANIADKVLVLVDANQLIEAEAFALKHLEALQRADNLAPCYKLYSQLGKLYRLKGENSIAIKYLALAINGYIELGEIHFIVKYSKLLADILIDIDPIEAKKYYNLSINYLSHLDEEDSVI